MVLRSQQKTKTVALQVPPPPPWTPSKGVKGVAPAISPPSPPFGSKEDSKSIAVISTPTKGKPRPTITLVTGEEHHTVYEAERYLDDSGEFFVSGGQLARITQNAGGLQCEPINVHTLTVFLSKNILWQRQIRAGVYEPIDVPPKIVTALLHNQDRKYLKTLNGIAHQPYFVPKTGELITASGFNAETGIYGCFDAVTYMALNAPTKEDALRCLKLLKAQLSEFEFEKLEDLAAAICAILTATIRTGLPLAPAFNFNATISGSGKSYLAKIVALFATPLPPYVTSYPTKAEEANKVILAMLLEKPAVILFDDMQTDWKPFGAINKALTSPTTTERVLGSSRTATALTNSLFIGTGNNVVPIKDMRRRVISVRMAPQSEAASLRAFKHTPYKEIAAKRSTYVRYALTIIQAYLLHGKRDETITPIGSYEEWSELCREPLMWLGEPDPASSLINQVKDNSDNEAHGVFLQEWRKVYIEGAVTVRELISLPHNHSNAKTPLLEIIEELPVTERGTVNPHRMGHYLKRHRGVRVNGLRIEDGKNSERKAWRVLTDDE